MSRLFIGTYTGETGSQGIYGVELSEGQEPSVYLAAETDLSGEAYVGRYREVEV